MKTYKLFSFVAGLGLLTIGAVGNLHQVTQAQAF